MRWSAKIHKQYNEKHLSLLIAKDNSNILLTALTSRWQPCLFRLPHTKFFYVAKVFLNIMIYMIGELKEVQSPTLKKKNTHVNCENENFFCTTSHRIHYHVTSHHGTTHGCWWNSRISFITYATTTT